MCFSKLKQTVKSIFKSGGATGEIPSPRVAIDRNDIILGTDIILKGVTAQKIDVLNTNSMEPALDAGHTIFISNAPKYMSTDVIKPGDVIIYKSWTGTGNIIHAVVEVGTDAQGWYCRTQGWHLNQIDPQIIREYELVAVALGIIWTGPEDMP